MTDMDAEEFLRKAVIRIHPLIDSLAKQVGESTEAWRGIDLVINGLVEIMHDVSEEEAGTPTMMTIVAIVLAGIDTHPALQAARQVYRKE